MRLIRICARCCRESKAELIHLVGGQGKLTGEVTAVLLPELPIAHRLLNEHLSGMKSCEVCTPSEIWIWRSDESAYDPVFRTLGWQPVMDYG
jgi:hypothetical protein